MVWSAFALAVLSLALVTSLARCYKAHVRRVANTAEYSPLWRVQIGYCTAALLTSVLPLWGDLSRTGALALSGIAAAIFALDMALTRRAARKFEADVAKYLPPKGASRE